MQDKRITMITYDLAGQRFYDLYVLEFAYSKNQKRLYLGSFDTEIIAIQKQQLFLETYFGSTPIKKRRGLDF